jgi:apolipoprotein D and lipocalin family protein
MKLLIIPVLLLLSCGKVNNAQPINNFNIDKYLGKWYEIARTDNRFEKNCTNVTANYSLRKDGGINVVNRCFVNGKEKTANGKGYFKSSDNIGALKVTFFWPFYGNYNVMYVDSNYQYAIVDGGSDKYLWILSREKSINDATLKMLLEKIKQNGFDPKTLIYTLHHD